MSYKNLVEKTKLFEKLATKYDALHKYAQGISTINKNTSSIFSPITNSLNTLLQNWALKSKFRGTVKGKIRCGWLPTMASGHVAMNNVRLTFEPDLVYKEINGKTVQVPSLDKIQLAAVNGALASQNVAAKTLLEKAFNVGGGFSGEYSGGKGIGQPDGSPVVEINFDLTD